MTTAPDTLADRPSEAQGDGAIRPFAAADATAVANLLVRAFQKSERAAPAGMADYLKRVYLDAPWFDPEIASRVAVDSTGRIVGFAGVIAQRMLLDGTPIRAAFTSSLATDDRVGDPTIAVRLMRDIHAGPQDAVLSDRANTVSIGLSRALKSEVMRDYSLDWLRILRPAGLAVAMAATRFKPAGLLAPLVAPFDAAALAKSQSSDEPHWTTPSRARQAANFSDRDAGIDELLDLIPGFLDAFPLRPDWSRQELETILTDAAAKSLNGDFVARVVLAPTGKPVGLFLYHLRKGQIAHLEQILAAPGREGVVIDRAIAHALECGAVAIQGRAQPNLLPALMERRVVLVPDLTTIVQSRNPDMLRHFRAGTAFFTGLAGENWMRLNGDRF